MLDELHAESTAVHSCASFSAQITLNYNVCHPQEEIMDHLITPSMNCAQPEPVPLFGLVQYDMRGFWGFLERIGINEQTLLDHIVRGDSPDFPRQYPPEYINSCLREWLFFGVLREFLSLWTNELGVNIFFPDTFVKT